jgi:hypothetical protein
MQLMVQGLPYSLWYHACGLHIGYSDGTFLGCCADFVTSTLNIFPTRCFVLGLCQKEVLMAAIVGHSDAVQPLPNAPHLRGLPVKRHTVCL